MSKTPALLIDDALPWPDGVRVVRGTVGGTRNTRYYVPESYPHEWEIDTEYARLTAENAKLRELCAELLDNLMPEVCAKAYWCSDKDWKACGDYACGNYAFVILARELGIEVDG